jgi:phage/plasmid-like protein (TIGR03299 family)
MPAEIANIVDNGAEATMMAYQGETPWHKLGTPMTGKPDVPAALAAAHLDWNVVLKSMYYRVGDKAIKVPSRRAVVRDTDGQLLSTVGGDYHPFQNTQAFSVLQPACEQLGVTIETAGALGKGDRVWMLAKLPEVTQPVLGDKIEQFILVLTGHNGWTGWSSRGTDVRVVCQNTLSMATRNSKAFITLRHTESAAEQFDQVAEVVTKSIASAKERAESYAKLAARQLTPDELLAYVTDALDLGDDPNPVATRRRDKVIELAAAGKGAEFAMGSLWNAFNALTEYVDHVRPAEAKNVRTIKQANESALFGTNMKVKQRALVLANRLAA